MSTQHAQYVLLLAVNSGWFQILQSYTLLLYSSHPGAAWNEEPGNKAVPDWIVQSIYRHGYSVVVGSS